MSKKGGIVGVSDHGGWAVLVTVARDGTLLDRRRAELVGAGSTGENQGDYDARNRTTPVTAQLAL
jgi:hypothetical protein